MKETKDAILAVRIDRDLNDTFSALAASIGMTRADIIRHVVEDVVAGRLVIKAARAQLEVTQ